MGTHTALFLPAFLLSMGMAAVAQGPAEYASGVWIDWKRKTVEVAARVVLRQGELELFACAPKTREHESILVVKGRPLHIYQAMGLVGLTPGSPVQWDDFSKSWRPSTGEALDLRVRYSEGDIEYTVPIEYWLVDLQTRKPKLNIPWVFAGSRFRSDGSFGGDVEGTVVAVVNFETAIIGLSTLHSADNALLWLGAATSRVPQIGTDCELLIRSRASPRREIHAELTAEGRLRTGDDFVPVSDLIQRVKPRDLDSTSGVLVVEASTGVAAEVMKNLQGELRDGGVNGRDLELRPAYPEHAEPRFPAKPDPG